MSQRCSVMMTPLVDSASYSDVMKQLSYRKEMTMQSLLALHVDINRGTRRFFLTGG